MTDLQCAARVFVARHGEAAYEGELLSDAGGWLTALGRDQARGLAEAMAGERIARVWTSDMARAVQTGEIVAGVLGVDVVVRKGLRDGDLTARIAGAESGDEVVQRYRDVLEEIADAHRGESVLVVSHGGVMCMALSALARNLALSHSRDLPMPNCGVVAMEGDDDGWVARSWAGATP